MRLATYVPAAILQTYLKDMTLRLSVRWGIIGDVPGDVLQLLKRLNTPQNIVQLEGYHEIEYGLFSPVT